MSKLAKPPIPQDVSAVVGEYAEKVENRSLLLEKFIIHKCWPVENSVKWDDASRWSFLRIVQNGKEILQKEEQTQRNKAHGNGTQANIETATMNAAVLSRLIPCACRGLPPKLETMRQETAKHFMGMFKADKKRHAVVVAELKSRMAINLSDSLIPNAGICLDRMWGTPFIPGSAVKGVSRHVALEALRNNPTDEMLAAFLQVFGSVGSDFANKGELAAFAGKVPKEKQDRKGGVDFLDAKSVTDVRIVVDLTNVHFPDYYRTGIVMDLKQERPQPNPFLAIEQGAEFAFCIALNGMSDDSGILSRAREYLLQALEIRGIGAKTASGYGWFQDVTDAFEHKESERIKQTAIKNAEEEFLKKRAQIKEEISTSLNALSMANPLPPDTQSLLDEALSKMKKWDIHEQILDDKIKSIQNRLPQAQPIDVLRAKWNSMSVIDVILTYIKDFPRRDLDTQKVILGLLREKNGRGRDVWLKIKDPGAIDKKIRGPITQSVQRIVALCKEIYGEKEKMPK